MDVPSLKLRFGSSPPASGDSPLFSESDPGTLAASAAAATGNHRRCRWGPPPLTGKFISSATAELLLCRIEAVDSDGHLRWKGSRAREGNGYKLWYSGSSSARNGVGVVVAGRLKDDVVRVTRRSDRIMTISVLIDGEAINVALLRGFGFGERNEEGRTILEFATAHDMVVANSFFKKSEAHLITFQSGGHYTQIDYLLVRKGDLACKDCRAFPGETCSSRYRLNLKGEAVETFRAIVSEKLTALEEDMSARNADQMWNTLASVIRDVAKESLGVASESARTHSTHKESWWFGKEVQTKVATKQSRFKELFACNDGNQEGIDLAKERYKVAKKEAKIAVAQAKDKAYEDLYRKLDSKEGANDIYKIAKARERKRMDIGNVRYIKDEGGRTIVREEDIRKRWG
ncbi:retrovirus-related pol polyprotein LINE-1 [Tanacetum coccineum]